MHHSYTHLVAGCPEQQREIGLRAGLYIVHRLCEYIIKAAKLCPIVKS